MDEKEELLYLRTQNQKLKEDNLALHSKLMETEEQKAEVEEKLYRIKNSLPWKLTKPLRLVRVGFIRLGYYGSPKRILEKIKSKKALKRAYSILGTESFPTPEKRKEEESAVFPAKCTFSILVPLYNTPENFLRDMIESVMNQTYGDWELVLADGSDGEHSYVGEVAKSYADKDNRIKYHKLEKNEGISGNTNQCYRFATGDYIGLFDHDDILHPSAFYEYRKAIEEKKADYVYCDEATFTGNSINNMITLHFKPDYALDTLRANNYICHFSLFKKELLKETDLFRTEFDGSQDHDMILRLTSLAHNVVHIPRILYYWRAHAGSVASDINAKLYCIDAAKRAVADHLRNYGIYNTAIISTRAFETIFRLQYELTTDQKVSVIIPCRNPGTGLRDCVNALEKLNTYPNLEIVIVENESSEEESKRVLEELGENPLVRVYSYPGEYHKSAMMNFGVSKANGEFYLFLNPDLIIKTPDFVKELLMYAQRTDVGAVGGKLLFSNEEIEHGGIVVGIGREHTAGHIHYRFKNTHIGYMGRLCYAQNTSAVSGDCLMVSKSAFDQCQGFCEQYHLGLYDVDFCLRLRKAGLLNVFTPFAEGYLNVEPVLQKDMTAEESAEFSADCKIFKEFWKEVLEKGDPYYNENFSLDCFDYTLKIVEKPKK